MTLLIVDGQNVAWRTAYVFQHLEFGMEFGFLQMLAGLTREHGATGICVAWESRCEWRRELFPNYKDNKTRALLAQESLSIVNRITSFREVLSWLVPNYTSPGCEADDVIAALTYLTAPDEIKIVSTDKDLQQLVTDRSTWLNNAGGHHIEMGPTDVCAKWGVRYPYQLAWYRAMRGDTSDNMKGTGIPGKYLVEMVKNLAFTNQTTVEQMASHYAQIESAANHYLSKGWLKRFKEKRTQTLRNFALMSLIPPRIGPYIACTYNPNFNRFLNWLKNTELSSLMARLINLQNRIVPMPTLMKPLINNPWPSYKELLEEVYQVFPELTPSLQRV